MIRGLILRNTRTLATVRIKDSCDEFKFEKGTYFVKPEKVFLKRITFGYRPHLFYLEGISNPIDLTKLVILKSKDTKEERQAIFIDAYSIHQLTSKKLLEVLAGDNITEWLIVILVIISIIIGVVHFFV